MLCNSNHLGKREQKSTANFSLQVCGRIWGNILFFFKWRSKRPMNSSRAHYFGKWLDGPWPVPPTVCQLQEQIGPQGFRDSCVCAGQRHRQSGRNNDCHRRNYKSIKSQTNAWTSQQQSEEPLAVQAVFHLLKEQTIALYGNVKRNGCLPSNRWNPSDFLQDCQEQLWGRRNVTAIYLSSQRTATHWRRFICGFLWLQVFGVPCTSGMSCCVGSPASCHGQKHVTWICDSKLTTGLNESENGCVMNCRLVKGPTPTPVAPHRISGYRNGWMVAQPKQISGWAETRCSNQMISAAQFSNSCVFMTRFGLFSGFYFEGSVSYFIL